MEKDKKTLHDHFIVIQNLLFIGIAVMLSTLLFQSSLFSLIPFILGLVLMLGSVLYATRYFKCPHCKAQLDPRRKVPNFCPNCGKELQ